MGVFYITLNGQNPPSKQLMTTIRSSPHLASATTAPPFRDFLEGYYSDHFSRRLCEMCELYEVDPDGDLLIILPSTEEVFALWNDSDDLEALPEVLESNSRDGVISSPSTTDEGSLRASYPSPSPLRLKVSSKHLMLASGRFKKMLTGDWVEATIIHPDGYRHVTLEGFDPSALKLLLDIIHGKTRKVPRDLDLEMLAKVSVLVDDFECHEEVEVFSDIWLNNLPCPTFTEYNRDLVLWILISSIFRKSALFKSATRTAILHSTGPIQTLGLPVRNIIVDKIDQQRQELLDQLIKTLHGLLDKLREGQPLCSFECDSILLGALIKQMYPRDLIWPKPSKPFTGFNFAKTAEAVRCLKTPAWCAVNKPEPDLGSPEDEWFKPKKKGKAQRSPIEEVQECPQHRCSLRILLNPKIDCLQAGVKGLDLEGDIGV